MAPGVCRSRRTGYRHQQQRQDNGCLKLEAALAGELVVPLLRTGDELALHLAHPGPGVFDDLLRGDVIGDGLFILRFPVFGEGLDLLFHGRFLGRHEGGGQVGQAVQPDGGAVQTCRRFIGDGLGLHFLGRGLYVFQIRDRFGILPELFSFGHKDSLPSIITVIARRGALPLDAAISCDYGLARNDIL